MGVDQNSLDGLYGYTPKVLATARIGREELYQHFFGSDDMHIP
jgi:hypothetical protein